MKCRTESEYRHLFASGNAMPCCSTSLFIRLFLMLLFALLYMPPPEKGGWGQNYFTEGLFLAYEQPKKEH